MRPLNPDHLRVRLAGRSAVSGRRRYRVEMLGRVLVTGTRTQVYRFLRPRLQAPEALSELFREVA